MVRIKTSQKLVTLAVYKDRSFRKGPVGFDQNFESSEDMELEYRNGCIIRQSDGWVDVSKIIDKFDDDIIPLHQTVG